jgi:uncharacterized protein (DUF433 family)
MNQTPVLPSSIQKRPGVCRGDACIRDTRHTVWSLVERRRLGQADGQILQGHPDLTPADLDAAWDYCQKNLTEIELAISLSNVDLKDRSPELVATAIAELEHQREESRHELNRKYARLGWLLMLANFVNSLMLFVGAVGLSLLAGSAQPYAGNSIPARLVQSLIFFLFAGPLVTAPTGVLVLALCRFVPSWRGKGGGWILFLAILPWLLWILFTFMALAR